MAAEVSIHVVEIIPDGSDPVSGCDISLQVLASEMDGAIPVGSASVDGSDYAVVLVVYPTADVDLLVPESLGAVVKAALQSVAG